ncbi:hypothetical protein ACQEVC_18445 [Plantactinospora sp. CA-294935]|uniref:hypothetical protein n=1 Tax=Plantactinospora sp. CA-294935 TaxID=3240012 RepID=UPI003D8F9553
MPSSVALPDPSAYRPTLSGQPLGVRNRIRRPDELIMKPGRPPACSRRPLFGGAYQPVPLTVTDTRTFDSGAALVTYGRT